MLQLSTETDVAQAIHRSDGGRTAPAAANGAPCLQRGFIISAEAMLVVTILVLGTIVGWVTIRDSANAELLDVANALEHAVTVPYFSDPRRGAEEPEDLGFVFCTPTPGEGGECIVE